MSRYPDNFRGTNFDHAEAVWSFREDDAIKSVEALIAKYTDADELTFDVESGLFTKECEDHGADISLCEPEIEKAVGARLVTLTQNEAA